MNHVEVQIAHFIKLNPIKSHISTKGNCDRGPNISTHRGVNKNSENVPFHRQLVSHCRILGG